MKIIYPYNKCPQNNYSIQEKYEYNEMKATESYKRTYYGK